MNNYKLSPVTCQCIAAIVRTRIACDWTLFFYCMLVLKLKNGFNKSYKAAKTRHRINKMYVKCTYTNSLLSFDTTNLLQSSLHRHSFDDTSNIQTPLSKDTCPCLRFIWRVTLPKLNCMETNPPAPLAVFLWDYFCHIFMIFRFYSASMAISVGFFNQWISNWVVQLVKCCKLSIIASTQWWFISLKVRTNSLLSISRNRI